MSLKPPKVGDAKQKQNAMNAKMARKKKSDNALLPPYTAIFCEGTKTEPLYFGKLAERINSRFMRYSKKPRIHVNGMGRGCANLREISERKDAEAYFNAQRIWYVYDKDDFLKSDFDKLYFKCLNDTSNRLNAAWSNECIELWFLLHFQELHSALNRNQIIELLGKHIPYSKNDSRIYDTLEPLQQEAIKRAEKLLSEYGEGTAPSRMDPGTNVVSLVKELNSYLGK